MRRHIAGREIDISQEEKGPELNQLLLRVGVVLLKFIKKFPIYILFKNYEHQNLSTSNFGGAKVYASCRKKNFLVLKQDEKSPSFPDHYELFICNLARVENTLQAGSNNTKIG